MIPKLPSNWAASSVGEVCSLVNGRAFRPTEWSEVGLPIIRIQNLRDPQAPCNRYDGPVEARHLVEDGDILFAWSGNPGTSFGAHIWSHGAAVLNQHIFKLVFDERVVAPLFLMLAMNAALPDLISRAKGGAGLKHLTKGLVEAIPLPLPPRSEQERIVAVVEAAAGPVSAVKEDLLRLEASMSALEKSLIAAAVGGRLAGARQPDGGWPEVPIGECGEVMLGHARNPKRHEGPKMRPYLRVANVYEDSINVADVMQMNFSDEEFERYALRSGDILLNEGQSLELVGRAAVFRDEVEGCCFTNTLIRFRAGPLMDPDFALLVFRHYLHSGRFRAVAKITTNLAHLGRGRFAALRIPLPARTEQDFVVARCKRLLAIVDEGGRRTRALITTASDVIGMLEAFALAGKLSSRISGEVKPHGLKQMETARNVPGAMEGKRFTMSKILSVTAALREAGTGLSGQDLFRAAGYGEDASITEAERFFVDLRTALREEAVRVVGSSDASKFELATAGAR